MSLCDSCKDSAKDHGSNGGEEWEPGQPGGGTDPLPTSDTDIDSNPVESDGKSNGGGGAGDGKILEDVVKNAIEEILNRDDVQRDIEQTQSRIRNFKPDAPFLPNQRWESERPTKMIGIKNAIISEFTRLRENCDPGWKTRVDGGRLNIQRYISTDDSEISFDVWREGNSDATDIEAVVLVDRSGSMSTVIHETMEAMWVIKNALGSIDAPCTVITYSDSAGLLYKGDEKASSTTYRNPWCGGGTDPFDGILQAVSILHDSPRKKKILISITDGAWLGYGNRNPQDVISMLTDAGVYTSMLYLPTSDSPPVVPSHGHSMTTKVENPQSIVTFVRELVTNVIKSGM